MPSIMSLGDAIVEFYGIKIGQRMDETLSFNGPFEAGCASCCASQAARLGVDSGIFAKVGRDGFAVKALGRLAEDGVDLRGIAYSEATNTGANFCTYAEDGSRSFIFHYANSAMGELSPDDLKPELLDDCKYFVLCGATAKATPSLWASTLKCIDICKQKHIPIAFDPNFRAELHSKGLYKIWAPLLDNTSVFLGSAEELMLFAEKDSVEAALAAYPFCNMDIIVLKANRDGARIITREKTYDIPPFRIPQGMEVDPTGAGDCWGGCFVAMLAKGADIETAGRYANAAGALCVTRTGAMSCATLQEIEQLVHSSKFPTGRG